MKVFFLGGASAIGASCTLLELGDHWILIDAGIRMDANADRLPDLSVLQGKPLAAIFVTHAHADHIGALPLVHQSFPTVPIFASRATMLLMEVMLSDALQVMQKRATVDFEVPLYDESQVASTLHALRPLPISGTITVNELPGVTIHLSRAGHVAGAISIGFESPAGSILFSGDISVTPQHTISGAQLSSLKHPDVFVVESTYGARLHPNRQAEEERLAITIAEGIEREGHVLIPAFALGRAQEVLRIVHMLQRRGTIPEFPVWVDGLVRRVCATYTAMPAALSPMLQKQLQRGYPVFFTGMIRPVADARARERILQGPPSCIVTSSGMLTGGPSAFYAARIADDARSSILITGYQDAESPGRKLLDLADSTDERTLDLGEQHVVVRAHFSRYHLSAHADGNELTAMVSALKPKQVMLVHGDVESRMALARRMERFTDIMMPIDGQVIEIEPAPRPKTTHKTTSTSPHVAHTKGTTNDANANNEEPDDDDDSEQYLLHYAATRHRALDSDTLESLWMLMQDGSTMQMVSVREMALAWYGIRAGEQEENHIKQVIDAACRDEQHNKFFFVPEPDLPGLYRVRQPNDNVSDDDDGVTVRRIQPGTLLVLQSHANKLGVGVCYDVRADAVWVHMAANDANRRRFPRAAVLELVGKWHEFPIDDVAATRQTIADMVKATQQWQRKYPPRAIVERMQPNTTYQFDDVVGLVGDASNDLTIRLAIAFMLHDTPRLFVREHDTVLTMQRARYRLHPEWQTAIANGAGDVRPDQMRILSVLEQHIGTPPDLYRRSVNPDTGEVTLSFHFPAKAREIYKQPLAAAAQETGVIITIASQPHQSILAETAHALVPTTLTVTKTSVRHENETIRLRCVGTISLEDIRAASTIFYEKTGWHLEIEIDGSAALQSRAVTTTTREREGGQARLDLHAAMNIVRATLPEESNFYKVSANQLQGILTVRFHFPDVARERYATHIETIAQRTGWKVAIYSEPHQDAMSKLARQVIPAGLELVSAPSLHRKQQHVVVKVRGSADDEAIQHAKIRFQDTTGWALVVEK